jgi:hypothetical protein
MREACATLEARGGSAFTRESYGRSSTDAARGAVARHDRRRRRERVRDGTRGRSPRPRSARTELRRVVAPTKRCAHAAPPLHPLARRPSLLGLSRGRCASRSRAALPVHGSPRMKITVLREARAQYAAGSGSAPTAGRSTRRASSSCSTLRRVRRRGGAARREKAERPRRRPCSATAPRRSRRSCATASRWAPTGAPRAGRGDAAARDALATAQVLARRPRRAAGRPTSILFGRQASTTTARQVGPHGRDAARPAGGARRRDG